MSEGDTGRDPREMPGSAAAEVQRTAVIPQAHDVESASELTGAPAVAGIPPVITVCPNGPLLVRGDFAIAAEPGAQPAPPGRRVVALCRCGMTSIAPHCDGSHKLARVRAFAPRSDEGPGAADDRGGAPGAGSVGGQI